MVGRRVGELSALSALANGVTSAPLVSELTRQVSVRGEEARVAVSGTSSHDPTYGGAERVSAGGGSELERRV